MVKVRGHSAHLRKRFFTMVPDCSAPCGLGNHTIHLGLLLGELLVLLDGLVDGENGVMYTNMI